MHPLSYPYIQSQRKKDLIFIWKIFLFCEEVLWKIDIIIYNIKQYNSKYYAKEQYTNKNRKEQDWIKIVYYFLYKAYETYFYYTTYAHTDELSLTLLSDIRMIECEKTRWENPNSHHQWGHRNTHQNGCRRKSLCRFARPESSIANYSRKRTHIRCRHHHEWFSNSWRTSRKSITKIHRHLSQRMNMRIKKTEPCKNNGSNIWHRKNTKYSLWNGSRKYMILLW